MELLSEIRRQIDLLSVKPEEIDVDETRTILSEAYEVARDGLERSQHADLYLQTKTRLEEIESERDNLNEALQETAAKLNAAEKKLEAFAGVLVELRREVGGQVALVKSYSANDREKLQNQAAECTISELLLLRSMVREAFNREWDTARDRIPLEKSEKIIEFKNFKTGA